MSEAVVTQAFDANATALEDFDVSSAKLMQSDQHWGYFARLRDEAPVHYCKDSMFGPYWSITRFAVIYAWLAPAGLAKLIGSLVFTYSHRNRKPNTDLWVGLITFGEGFNEVHHRKPRLQIWHPLDIGGQLIRLIDRNVGT